MRCVILSHTYLDPATRGKLRALAGHGCTVVAAVPGGASTADGTIQLAPVGTAGDPADPASHRWSGPEIHRLLSDFRPDLLQIEEEAHTEAAATAANAALRLAIPTVLFSMEGLPRSFTIIERMRRNKVLRRVSGVIGGNRMASDLLGAVVGEMPRTVLPQMGVSPPPEPVRVARSDHGLRIGFAGRLVPERGADLLLRACAKVMGPWTLRVAGTGPEQEALEDLAERLGIASRIQWLGGLGRAETDALWPDLDCLAVPSRTTATWIEGSSPVLLQAMAHGVAPVVTAEGVLPETVGDAGIVVGDAEAMGGALQQLLADPKGCDQLGLAARRRILAHYPDPVIADRTLAFWRDVLREAGAPVRD